MENNFDALKVLIIDDEEGMRLGIERSLKKFQIEVPQYENPLDLAIHHAKDGEAGLELIEQISPHIVLLDNKLPGIHGIDMLKLISEMDVDIVTVMITAYASIESAVTAMKYGAFDFLPKPFTPEELKYMVRKAVKHVALTLHARKLAEERQQVRFQFISVLAHELKSPLNAIESYLSIMGDHSAGDNPEVYGHMVSRSLTRLEYMKKLIGDLLDMTRIESGQRKRNIETLNIPEIAEIVLDSYKETAAERDITLKLEIENVGPFFGDGSEIEIVLNNLVSNAVKYNRDHGSVLLKVSSHEDFLRLAVTDTGIGLSDEEKDKLFRDFVRIKTEETKKILGSGLGLSIVKKIAELYNGSAGVESECGKGSTFTILLKACEIDDGGNHE